MTADKENKEIKTIIPILTVRKESKGINKSICSKI
jgi:hypothetical protein